jgi:histone deacetylase 1/2
MKPHKVLVQYGLLDQMQVLRPHPAGEHDLCRFRADDYISFICPLMPDGPRLSRTRFGPPSP